jgi:hypothetical protein
MARLQQAIADVIAVGGVISPSSKGI